MPLRRGVSDDVIRHNVRTEIRAGRHPSQAAAIAFASARRDARARGMYQRERQLTIGQACGACERIGGAALSELLEERARVLGLTPAEFAALQRDCGVDAACWKDHLDTHSAIKNERARDLGTWAGLTAAIIGVLSFLRR